jgi:hypothetical protein
MSIDNYTYLIGADTVRQAATDMESAAGAMQCAADDIEATLQRFGQRVDQWMTELRELVERIERQRRTE